MSVSFNERAIILKRFLKKWDFNKLKRLTLKDYALGGKNSKSTFSYWIEEETSSLGGISGIGGGGSFRYGIYIKKGTKKYRKNSQYLTDGKYAWRTNLGNNPNEVFTKIRKAILDVYKYTKQNKYEKIDAINDLFPTVKWKIAYLYSNGYLSPFFSHALLKNVAKLLGMNLEGIESRAELYKYISTNRKKAYPDIGLFEFSDKMWAKFGKRKVDIPNNDPDLEMVLTGKEGKTKKVLKNHLAKERDSKFRNKYRKKYSYIVKCPACNFSFESRYGINKSNNLLELHHIIPLKYREKEYKIEEKDVTLLCPNCHRAIHKMMVLEERKKIELKEFKRRIKRA